MQIEISKQEAWKLLDAIDAYSKNYSLSVAVNKTFSNISEKLKKVTKE